MRSAVASWGRFLSLSAEARDQSPTRVLPEARPTLDDLFRRHAGDVHRLVWRLLGPGASAADVEDLGQQIFMAVHKALPSFRGESKASTWLYGIATRTVYRELRSRTRHRRMVATLQSAADLKIELSRQERHSEDRAELAKVWRCLLALHPKKRVVFLLHELEGLSGKEIAELLQIKEPTVHTRLFHARKELQRALEAAP
jgi:RNA polymerase sigma-70 factor, ECF subfamily